jgi:hypothetical protein
MFGKLLGKQPVARLEMDGDIITITSGETSLRLAYPSIDSLYINQEQGELARELEISLGKVQRDSPELADLLRVQLSANGLTCAFVTNRTDAAALSARAENWFREIMSSAKVLSGSLADDWRRQRLAEEPAEIVYPIYFHGCRAWGDEEAEAEEEAA